MSARSALRNAADTGRLTDEPKSAAPDDIRLSAVVLGTIGLSLAFQLRRIFTHQGNGDEFSFLARVYEYQRGTLTAPLQNFHVHLFGWLSRISGSEIDQIVAGRLFMLVLETGMLGLVYYAARRFVARDAALLGVLSYAVCNFVIAHGASFRTDPIATFLLMSAVALMLAPRLCRRQTLFAGVAVALAGLVTIKSVFYLPVIVAIAAWRLVEAADRRAMLLILAVGGVASAGAFGLFYALHVASLAGAQPSDVVGAARGSAGKVIMADALFGSWRFLLIGAAGSPVTFAAIVAGIWICARGAINRSGVDRRRQRVLLAFAFPAATILFYRNSFPYYYAFALAPAAVLAAIAFDRIRRTPARLIGVCGLSAALVALQFAVRFQPGQDIQRNGLAVIHAMFPEPVSHIDPCYRVARYPEAGFFMSTWGMESYRAAGRPRLRNAIEREAPQFVIAGHTVLAAAFNPGAATIPAEYRLLEADERALRENYIHHRGEIWIAGKTIEDIRAGEVRSVDVRIPGPYTVEAGGEISIDSRDHAPGDVVTLSKGPHLIAGGRDMPSVTLRWAHRQTQADASPDLEPSFGRCLLTFNSVKGG